jgi:protein required for attachment to host cells
MPPLKLKQGEWVVVCDGAKALILENAGDDKFPNLRTRETYQQEVPPSREQGSDVPGRTWASIGAIRSAMEETDWHEAAERSFLERLVARLHAATIAGEVSSMVVVAPPRALGIMRQACTPQLRQAVRAEIDKDYVKLPVFEIETLLCGTRRK